MKNILFFINSLSGGGAEKVLVELVNSLPREKYSITVCTLANDGIYQSMISPEVKVTSLIKVKNRWLRWALSWIVLFVIPPKWTHQHFLGERYDVEIAYLEGFPTKLISKSTNRSAKKIAWVHIDLVNYDKNGRIFKSIDEAQKAYQVFDAIYCVSNDVREKFILKYGFQSKTFTQYNVVDERTIKALSQEKIEPSKKEGKLSFVSVGRLADQKGYDRLIMACLRLRDYKDKFHITIVGDGPDRAKLNQMVVDYDLSDNIELVGFRKNPYPYIGQADCFLCSSRAEGFSTVSTEAIILGKPIITTDCAGMRDLFGGMECGLIVENSVDGIAKGISQVLNDPDSIYRFAQEVEKRRVVFTKAVRIGEMEKILDE